MRREIHGAQLYVRLDEEPMSIQRHFQKPTQLFVIRIGYDAGAQHDKIGLYQHFLAQPRIAHRHDELIVLLAHNRWRLLVIANEDDTAFARPPIEIFQKAVRDHLAIEHIDLTIGIVL
ncbi:hypothetical protein HRbin07_00727 [bacterium HR07]|nr:hypothetical protein HRbin07_00727 [bacterium HR07]